MSSDTDDRVPPGGTLTDPAPSSSESAPRAELVTVPTEHYRLGKEHARGGLGRIREAFDHRLGRTVAIKELLSVGLASQQRFLREARLTARLQHPSIVPVHEAGQWPNGDPFYCMKLVTGQTLKEAIANRPTLDQRLGLLPHALAIAEAVAYAHEQRIIHRDLKPSNVLVGEFGETVVIDWGLAKDLSATDDAHDRDAGPYRRTAADGLTAEGAVVGTPGYMPLEQAQGDHVDERADVYSIGAILYHVLAGAPPYAGQSSQDVLKRVLAEPPTPLEQCQPGVPRDLAAIVSRAMSREPANRYATAKTLADDLRRFQTGQLVTSHHYSRGALLARWLRKHRVPVAIAALALTVLAIGAAVSVVRIVQASRLAEAQRLLALARGVESENARAEAEAKANQLILDQARTSLTTDPTATIAWLKTYPPDGKDWHEVRNIAADALSRGVARHSLAHRGVLIRVEYSKDGEMLFTVGRHDAVRVWEVESGRLVYEKRVVEDLPAVAWSRDGRYLAHAGVKSDIEVWDRLDNKTRTLTGPPGLVTQVAFVGEGSVLASSTTGSPLQLWDLATNQPRPIGPPIEADVFALHGNKDGTKIFGSGADGTISVWNLGDSSRRVLGRAQGPIYDLQLSPDGQHVASIEMGRGVHLWDTGTGSRRVISDEPIVDFAFAPGGQRVAWATEDGRILMSDLVTHQTRSIHAGVRKAFTIAFSPDGRTLVTGSVEGNVGIVDLESGEQWSLYGHPSLVGDVAYSPSGSSIATGCDDKTVRLWKPPVQAYRTLRGNEARILHLSYPADDRYLVSAGVDAQVRVWTMPAGTLATFRGHQRMVTRARIAEHADLIASSGDDGTVRLWNPGTGLLRVLSGHTAAINDVAVSSDGSWVVSGGADSLVFLWDAAKGVGRPLAGHDGEVFRVAIAPDDRVFASVGDDKLVRLWGSNGRLVRALSGHQDVVCAVAFSPDSRRLVTGAWDGSVYVWDIESGTGQPLAGPADRVRSVAFSHDGKYVAAGGDDGVVHLWDSSTGADRPLVGHHDKVVQVAFSPDDSLVASVSVDGTLRLWRVSDGACWVLRAQQDALFALAFARSGETIAVGGNDGVIRVWALPDLDQIPNDAEGLRRWFETITSETIATTGR